MQQRLKTSPVNNSDSQYVPMSSDVSLPMHLLVSSPSGSVSGDDSLADDGSRGYPRGAPPRHAAFLCGRRLPSTPVLLALNAILLSLLLLLILLLYATPSAVSSGRLSLDGAAAAASGGPSFNLPNLKSKVSGFDDEAAVVTVPGKKTSESTVVSTPTPTPTPAQTNGAHAALVVQPAPTLPPPNKESPPSPPPVQTDAPASPPAFSPATDWALNWGNFAVRPPHHSTSRLLGHPEKVKRYTADRDPPFMWPRPLPRSVTSSLFVTATPNKGAGIGHQFGEWLYGPWVANMWNATYLHSPFLGNGARWNKFLGLGDGEDTLADFQANFVPEAGGDGEQTRTTTSPQLTEVQLLSRQQANNFNYLVRTWDQEFAEGGRVWKWLPRYVATQRAESVARLRKYAAEGFSLVAPPTAAHALLDPQQPKPSLVHFHEVHVHTSDVMCGPDTRLLQTLRRKYCRARVTQPKLPNLYAADRARNSIVVALHLRCGDSCYETFRPTPFPSIVYSVQRMHAVLTKLEPDRPLSFHLFSQKPDNNTAENHFAPLLHALKGIQVTTHFSTSSFVTLHHLVTSDVLLGSQSSFSWLALLLHHGVSMSPIQTCVHQVEYNKFTGVFKEQQLAAEYTAAKAHRPKFDTFQDCLDIQPHTMTRPVKLLMEDVVEKKKKKKK